MLTHDIQLRRLTSYLFAAGCLLLFFYFSLSAAVAKAPVTDEPLHLVRGVLLRQSSDLALQGEQAPLSHRLIGLLLGPEARLPQIRQLSTWPSGNRLEIAGQLLWASGIDVERTFLLARLPIALLGLLTAAMVGSWALAWHGKVAMMIALLLFATSPNLIAHAALATTDLATAAFFFATLYMWWLYVERGQKRWWALTGILMGLALATKLSTVLLLPVTLAQALLFSWPDKNFWRSARVWLGLLPLAAFSAWAAYGFEFGPSAVGIPYMPAPTYWASWSILFNHMETGHPSFFWGALSGDGWWFYFPVTFLIKTPLVTLALLVLSLVITIRRRALWPTALFLLLPVGALFSAATLSRLNIGYRHVLGVLPFLLVYVSTAALVLQRRRVARVVLALALLWSLLAAVWQHPDQLAYFNELVGGTAQGYRYLGDSNLDWGQDINLLAATTAATEGPWRISYSGSNDPAYYGLPADELIDPLEALNTFPVANPPPGSYAISANHLQGQLPDPDFFDWFRRQQPVDELGGSILIYEVAQQLSGSWIAHCLDPAPLLTTGESETLLASENARHILFDCRQSLVLPAAGAPGYYILPQADSWWFQEQLPAVGRRLQLIYRHHPLGSLPSFDVYYWPGAQGGTFAEGRVLTEGWAQSAESLSGEPLSLPRQLNDAAELFAYRMEDDGWSTLWRIISPAAEPLSIQAHLYSVGESLPQIGDSLGFSSEQWQPGDWLLQRHSFPEQQQGSFLQTAIYNYATLELFGEELRLPGPTAQP